MRGKMLPRTNRDISGGFLRLTVVGVILWVAGEGGVFAIMYCQLPQDEWIGTAFVLGLVGVIGFAMAAICGFCALVYYLLDR